MLVQTSGGLGFSQRLLVESPDRLIKRSHLGRHSLVLTPQSFDARQLSFDRLLTGTELLIRPLKQAQRLMGVVFASMCYRRRRQPFWLFLDVLCRYRCVSQINWRRLSDRMQTPIFPCVRL